MRIGMLQSGGRSSWGSGDGGGWSNDAGRDASTFETRFGRMTIEDIANQLAHQVERPIVDQTGLQGRFDLVLAYRPTSLNLPPTPSGAWTSPSLFVALPVQAGLRLESRSAPVDVLVIDDVARPIPD